MLQTRPGQNERAHTLISQFETPARIICETINPAPLLGTFFGGRHYSNDFRSPGNAMPRLALFTPLGGRGATPTQDAVCFVQLHE